MPREFLHTGAEPHYVDEHAEAKRNAVLDRHFSDPRHTSGKRPYIPRGCDNNGRYETASRNPTVPMHSHPEPPPTGRHVPPAEARGNRLRGLAAALGVPVAILLLVAALNELARFVAPLLHP